MNWLIDNETVGYVYIGGVRNITPFTQEISLEASSERDAGNSLISNPELEIITIQTRPYSDKYIEYNDKVFEGNKFTLPSFGDFMIIVQCEGKYGGKGKGERHPPEVSISQRAIVPNETIER